tara:strand:- start:216 stop:839 length:624 start_codon:yes stop_codon:yes gene_type:complete
MSGLMVNTLKSIKVNQDIIKELFAKIDQLKNEELSNLLIFNESFNWKAVLLPILKVKYELETIINFYDETIKLGNQFKLKSLMSPRLYSAHLNYYYGVVVEQSIREIKRQDFEKEKNILSKSSFDFIDNEIYIFLYGKSKLNLWKEFSLNFRLKSKSYYVPNKIYCTESDSFDYWLSKRRILRCTRELNASLLSRGLKYLKGLGIYE